MATPELQKLQRDDTDIGPILLWKENGSRQTFKELENKSPATRHYWHLWDAIEIREGLLFKKFHRKDGIEVYSQLLDSFPLVFFLPRCPDITELCIFFKTSFLISKGTNNWV
jgi:hypothetical protein